MGSHITAFFSFLQWHRRTCAALAAGLAVWCALTALGGDTDNVAVLGVSQTVEGGTEVADVTTLSLPRAAIPEGALTPGDDVACTAAVTIPRGSVLTRYACVGPAQVEGRPGRRLTPIRLADRAMASVLQVGAVVDVFAVGDDGARVLARGARVVAMPERSRGGMFGSGGGGGLLLVVETSAAEARQLAGATEHAHLSVTWGT